MTSISSSGDELNAREAQARTVRGSFEAAGYEPVTTPVLQPAEIFLDRHGEDLRRRTYLFNDPGGQELCLRPDLTIPVCRLYIEREPQGLKPARLCASGAIYRYQPTGSTKLSEYTQCGLELLGPIDDVEADAEVTRLALRGVEAAGLTTYEVELGDLALFAALIEALSIPEGWKERLKRQFWRPAFFADLLANLQNGEADRSDAGRDGLVSAMAGLGEDQAAALLEDVLKLSGIAPVGGRGVEEIAARLLQKADDATTGKLPKEAAALISKFLEISCPAADAVSQIRALTKEAGIALDATLDRLAARLTALGKAGVDLGTARFSTGFGRKLEYYTGHVFEIRVPTLGEDAVIAGGGRYDQLLQTLGAQSPVPAVGCAVALERLFLATTQSQKGSKK